MRFFILIQIQRRFGMSEKTNPLKGRTEYVTVQEAADHLRVSIRTIYRWLEEGVLKAFQTGRGSTRIAVPELEHFIAEHTGQLNKEE
jgi:excisionase family DNA binding protein